jgi:hypothetical protein
MEIQVVVFWVVTPRGVGFGIHGLVNYCMDVSLLPSNAEKARRTRGRYG